jgi:hypothetical protein
MAFPVKHHQRQHEKEKDQHKGNAREVKEIHFFTCNCEI